MTRNSYKLMIYANSENNKAIQKDQPKIYQTKYKQPNKQMSLYLPYTCI